jgi:exodeoxyribonuclease X
MRIRVIDFETTGIAPPEAGIVQIGQCDVTFDHGRGFPRVGMPSAMFVNPGKPIPPEARAVHHISDRDISDAPSPDFGLKQLMDGDPDYFVAHNAVFDRQFFNGNGRWVCTRKIAMRLWPEAPNHQNQTLRYFLGVDDGPDFRRDLAMPAHDAAADCYITAHLIVKAIETGTALEQMATWTDQPSLLPGAIGFGKHKGTPWPQVDPSYLEWCLKQDTMDSDVRFTAKHWLERRRCDAR